MAFQRNPGRNGMVGQFDVLRKIEWLRHGFTTKTFHDGSPWNIHPKQEDQTALAKARETLAQEMDIPPSSLVFSQQIHSDHIHKVPLQVKGVSNHPQEYPEIDGLITQEQNVGLVTFYADCVPLFFVDVKNKAIGLSHAGWKGTLLEIGPKTLKEMMIHFQSEPRDLLFGIGPSIGPCCFEVGFDVAQIMLDAHPWWDAHMTEVNHQKVRVNLWSIHKEQFLRIGGLEEHISLAMECTKCMQDTYHSYRRDGERAGRMAAFMAIQPGSKTPKG